MGAVKHADFFAVIRPNGDVAQHGEIRSWWARGFVMLAQSLEWVHPKMDRCDVCKQQNSAHLRFWQSLLCSCASVILLALFHAVLEFRVQKFYRAFDNGGIWQGV